MSKFSDFLASLVSAPKTLPQAKETIDASKATLDSIAALFTAAGLNLEQMLAAGPDALKAHLESIDNSEELAEALQENETIAKNLEEANGHIASLTANAAAFRTAFAAVGFESAEISAAEFKTKFDAHVKKAATLELAKTGHPPAHVPAATEIDDVTPKHGDEDKAAVAALDDYIKLIDADNKTRTKASAEAKTKFYAENHALIDRGMAIRRRQ